MRMLEKVLCISLLFAAQVASGKTVMCHIPPGNPANAHTISVGSQASASDHLAHGDCFGSCPCAVCASTGDANLCTSGLSEACLSCIEGDSACAGALGTLQIICRCSPVETCCTNCPVITNSSPACAAAADKCPVCGCLSNK
jgi:hypothetical protein